MNPTTVPDREWSEGDVKPVFRHDDEHLSRTLKQAAFV